MNVMPLTARAEVQIRISASPELPVANLAANSGFEEGGALPKNWPFAERSAYFYSSREPWRCTIGRKPSGGRNGAYLQMEVHTASILSELFVRQTIAVEPDTLYRAGVFARIRSGQAIIHVLNEDFYAYTAKSEMKVSWADTPLSPLFVPVGWTRSPAQDKWVWLETEVRSNKDEHHLHLGIGSYWERGSIDFDDVFFGVARTDLTVAVEGEELRGVVVADGAGTICWDSGLLPPGTRSISQKIEDVSTLGSYEVTATTASNQKISKWYPAKP